MAKCLQFVTRLVTLISSELDFGHNGILTILNYYQVSVEEWVSMWNDYAHNPSAALKWQQLYCHFMFQLEDASADGSIDTDEFTTVCSSYGIDPQECKVAFAKMSKVST